MRIEIGGVCVALLLAGCLQPKPPANLPPPSVKQKHQDTYVTPALSAQGRVEMVNLEGRFVVLSFPAGHVPPPGQKWRINHRGLLIGRVKITGPQRQIDTVADIVEGEANVGDEAAPE
ncbi:MAG TPA: hypothetical protein VK731_00345 [Candidatus Cybelea sp.]|jgi:hypothetical protein|nr:hypothetical protein [Candidatus Cybelea sp.]